MSFHAVKTMGLSQKELVLRHLQTEGSISQSEARQIYNVNRLAARICELRNEGVEIEAVNKRDPLGKNYSRYTLAA